MTRLSYEQTAGKIRKAVHLLAGKDNKMNVLFEPSDYEIGLAQKFEYLLKECPIPLLREETDEGIWLRETEPGNITK
jgi:hypothetical protein